MKPRLLDLFCGAGGAAMGYHRAGFEVVGVDIEPQPHYPFEFHRDDALRVLTTDLLFGFDVVHASPPCQDYSRAMRHLSKPTPRLIEPVLHLLDKLTQPWVVENVPGAPLVTSSDLFGNHGVELCGTMFGLRIGRHRLFQASLPVEPPERACVCRNDYVINPHNQAGRDRIYAEFGRQNPDPIWQDAMGVSWMSKYEAREAIPPAYTEYIGVALMESLKHSRLPSRPVS